MQFTLHDILDDAEVAFYIEGVDEARVRNAVVKALHETASSEIGPLSELACILDESRQDSEILEDLGEFNAWETPSRRDDEGGRLLGSRTEDKKAADAAVRQP